MALQLMVIYVYIDVGVAAIACRWLVFRPVLLGFMINFIKLIKISQRKHCQILPMRKKSNLHLVINILYMENVARSTTPITHFWFSAPLWVKVL